MVTRSREHHGVGKAQGAVLGAQLGGASRDLATEGDYLHPEPVDELLDKVGVSYGKGSDKDLAVGACRDQQLVAIGLSQARDGPLMMPVGWIEEADREAGVERYRSHSDRSPSR